MKKILSISVAAYNVEKYLQECLESFVDPYLLKQCEIIIVNDGSTDNTGVIAQKFVEQYPDTFIHIKKQNGGWGSTLNEAIKVANGLYFKQLDGDDSYNTANLVQLLQEIQKSESDIILTPYIEFDDATKKIIRKHSYEENFRNLEKMDLNEVKDFIFAMHAITVKTNILKINRVLLTEKCFYTDAEFVLKVLNYSNSMVYIDQQIYNYRVDRAGQSISIEGYQKHYEEHLTVVKKMLEYGNQNVDKDKEELYSCNLRRLVQDHYWIILQLGKGNINKSRMYSFDNYIKEKYQKYYSTDIIKLKVLRMIGFLFYDIIVGIKSAK